MIVCYDEDNRPSPYYQLVGDIIADIRYCGWVATTCEFLVVRLNILLCNTPLKSAFNCVNNFVHV